MSEDKHIFTDPDRGEGSELVWWLIGGLVGGLILWRQFGRLSGLHGALLIVLSSEIIGWLLWAFRRRYGTTNQKRLKGITAWEGLKHCRQRIHPSGEPQATDTALSLADSPDEAEHLTVSEDTEDEVSVNR